MQLSSSRVQLSFVNQYVYFNEGSNLLTTYVVCGWSSQLSIVQFCAGAVQLVVMKYLFVDYDMIIFVQH